MFYKESIKILEEIKKAKRILINCHRGPDLDSIGSALAFRNVLLSLGKEVEIVCTSETLYDDLSFLKGYKFIKPGVNFSKFDYSKFDLFVILDSASWSMVSTDYLLHSPNIKKIVIDHHHTNERFGDINLVDEERSAVGELLFLLFNDCNFTIDSSVATALLTGIIGDTGIFKYPNTTVKTFEIAAKLMQKGADREIIIKSAFRNYEFELVKFWGDVLALAKIDKQNRFVYSFIPYEVFEKWGKPENAKEIVTDMFAQATKDTDFGFVALEKEKNKLSISFRAREDFDTSMIAKELGGGGHKAASGGRVENMPFNKAVQKVLRIARKYARQNTHPQTN